MFVSYDPGPGQTSRTPKYRGVRDESDEADLLLGRTYRVFGLYTAGPGDTDKSKLDLADNDFAHALVHDDDRDEFRALEELL